MAVRIELDEAHDLAIYNCNPRLLASTSTAPFLNPRIIALHGSGPGIALRLSIVIAGQLMNCGVVDLADCQFITGLVLPNHGLWTICSPLLQFLCQ
ncbi:MAG: hypothetical protein AAGJ95_08745 [Cyanobacteria bacterium J06554_11]